jgi:hypothetical protein
VSTACGTSADCGGCSGGRNCEGNTCVCPPGLTFCDGSCVDTNFDNLHCGPACGVACGPGTACSGGTCAPLGTMITFDGEAYGHHGNCDASFNACGDAATCAQWACQANGYGTLVSFGEQRLCSQWSVCNLLFDGPNNGVQYNWVLPGCEVMGVGGITCLP